MLQHHLQAENNTKQMKLLVQPETIIPYSFWYYGSNTIYFPIPQIIRVLSQIMLQLFHLTFHKILDLALVSEDANLCIANSREIYSILFLRLIS